MKSANYTIKTDDSEIFHSVKIIDNVTTFFVIVKLRERKNNTISVHTKKTVEFSVDKYESFINDLIKRGGKKI